MKYYAAFFEEFEPIEKKITSFLFNIILKNLEKNKKKSKSIRIDNVNEKIWLKEKLLFHFNKQTRLLETESVQACKAEIIKACKLFPYAECSDFFKNLKFASSEADALMLSDNGLLFSQSMRVHNSKNSKNIALFNGTVSSSFALQQILMLNSGLALGHVHTDYSSYSELVRLLPVCKKQGVKILYLELPYRIFFSLFEKFNKDQNSDISPIMTELKKIIIKLYPEKDLLKNFRMLLLAARFQQINIQACDVISSNFINQSEQLLDADHRLNVGNACMIRSIEALQFQQKHPKFLLLVGLAHAPTIAHELGVPSCYIGDKKTIQDFSDLARIVDYEFFADNASFHAPKSNFFMKIPPQLDQTSDPKINEIVNHWHELIKIIPRFTSITASEIKAAREVYIEYILEKSRTHKREISDICKTQQSLIIESLTQAIYSKSIELAHPKNWYPLFYCQRPYGIRLAEGEANAFTVTHLYDNETIKTEENLGKLHYH